MFLIGMWTMRGIFSDTGRRCAVPILALIGALSGNPAVAGWLDSPDSIKLQNVGDETRLNGTPMTMRYFVSQRPLEEVIRQFQDAWERGHVRGSVINSKIDRWTVLNQSLGDTHRSVQVRAAADGGVEGYVALTSSKQTREPQLRLRLPSDVEVVSVLESSDQGRGSQQVIAVSRRALDGVSMSLQNALRAAGWTVKVASHDVSGARLSADKGKQEFDAALTQEARGTSIMMNMVFDGKP
ncbi:hypothetical protein [Collimonas humicola]|uniref:hypothetical protein n=1 Tax=Collimonas humicola TaxID=2825886 RepID=UPI001B8A8F29|nr:hypothetical protein [Collimonas humicola]